VPPAVHALVRREDQLAAIMATSRAVADGAAIQDTLEQIAHTAAELVHAQAAAIILRRDESQNGLSVAGSFGLSPEYADKLNDLRPLEMGHGPSGLAAQKGQPVCVADVFADPISFPWRELAVREHYTALVSVPMRLEGERVIGVLNAYRREAGPWTDEEVALLSSLADHGAIAIRTAQLLDDSRRQVQGLSLLVRSLRAQAHEHSNRLHAIYGLLALGEVDQAKRLIASVEERYHSVYGRVTAGIGNPTIAGFLVAECAVAGQSGIDVRIDRRSRLDELPATLGELEAITLLGNLIQNAVDAVSEMPQPRRRVIVRVQTRSGELVFTVRDWGRGIEPENVARMFDRDFTTKRDHAGIGLALVRSVVTRAGGRLEVEHPRGGGLSVTAAIPE
jgi:signal transduction histidine kinase